MSIPHHTLRLAIEHHRANRWPEAVELYRQILACQPDHADTWNLLGFAEHQLGRSQAGIECLMRSIELNSNDPVYFCNLGRVQHDLRAFESARSSFDRAASTNPNLPEAWRGLGCALFAMDRFHDAEPCFRRFLQLTGDTAEGHFNLATSLVEPNQLEEAIVGYQQAIRLNPDFTEAHNNLGLALSELTAWEAAEHCYQRALALRPDYADAHLNQSLAWLVQGDFQRGWPEYEWRLRTSGAHGVRDVHRPLWNGQPRPTATILLQAEQGLGDTLQFIRYAPLVKQRVGSVLVECEPELVDLLKSMPGIDRLVRRGEMLPDFDLHAPLLSLPGIFGTGLDTIPTDVPYLRPAESLVRQWHQTLSDAGHLRVGVAWQGSPRHRRDRWRSIPLALFGRLATLPRVQLYSIQVGEGREQFSTFSQANRVIDLADRIETLHDTAAILQNLDLLICCDSAVAHLAGAMGRPVWIALPFSPDWRWLLEREDSPWYPTMRLFRQQQPGDWTELFERIAEALHNLA